MRAWSGSIGVEFVGSIVGECFLHLGIERKPNVNHIDTFILI